MESRLLAGVVVAGGGWFSRMDAVLALIRGVPVAFLHCKAMRPELVWGKSVAIPTSDGGPAMEIPKVMQERGCGVQRKGGFWQLSDQS